MAPTAADEKRQEEKRIKELREFQRGSPANRRCFDCNEMMPQYVCLDFNTFVCTSCSGIHREFAHRVKSLSMSKFTESEVKALKLGGNEAAQKYWRSKHDASFRPHGGTDGERTRNFIRLTYIDRKWVYESPRAEGKKDDARKTASGSSRSKSSFTAPADDDFFTPSSKSKAAAAPAFDAFGGSSAAASPGGGFAQFGDFSAFGNDSSTSSASAEFADFGNFGGAPKSNSSSSANGFSDFGDFGGSSGSAKASAPAPSSSFAAFKIAPPVGASFSSSSSSSLPAAPPAPIVASPVHQVPNDFMAFSPEKVVKDPFGFDDPPAPPAASTPFDAFGAAPASNRSTSSASSAFDAFGTSTPAAVASDFGGFGSTPFDAFGGAASSTQPSASFDAFGAPAPASSASPFNAFGASGSSGSGGFGVDFAPVAPVRSSSGTIASVGAADPFGAFSSRVSSGSSQAPEPTAAASADPFAAFDAMDSAAPSAGGSSAGSFGSTSSAPNDIFGSSASQSLPGQGFPASSAPVPSAAPTNDPFAFAGQSGGSKNNSFSTPGAPVAQHQPNGAFAQGFGGGGANPFQQPQQYPPQQQHTNPMQNGMFIHHHQQQQPGQQQWYGHPQMQQQQHPAQFHMQQQGPHSGQFHMQHGGQHFPPPAHPSNSVPAAATVAKPTAAPEVAAIRDPFATLNIDLGSSASAASTSRGNSFDQKPGSASGSFSNGMPVGGATPPFSQSRQGSGSGVGMLGGSGDFPIATGSTAGSRGNSFSNQAAPSPVFGAPAMANTSPMSSFAFPAASQMHAPRFPGASQQPPMAPFSNAQNQSQHDAFADNAFGAFASAPARADSLKAATPSAAPANPFDMF